MNREELEEWILATYQTQVDFPWEKHPTYQVFRHSSNKKWFAVILEVPKEKLGLPGEGVLQVVNIKCDPIMVGSLRLEPGFFPAYHMNKEKWLTIALDGTVPAQRIQMLIDISFGLTAPKRKAPKQNQ